MPHLPEANNDQEKRLSNRPPQNSLIGTFAGCTKPILTPLQQQSQTVGIQSFCASCTGVKLAENTADG